jgi:hypothetical protein
MNTYLGNMHKEIIDNGVLPEGYVQPVKMSFPNQVRSLCIRDK